MGATTTRRAALGMLAAAPFAAASAGIPQGPTAPASFASALAVYRRANAAHDAAIDAQTDAEEAFQDARPPRPALMEEGLVLFANGRAFTIDEAEAAFRAERERREQADAGLRQRFRVDEAEARCGAACDASYAALDALLACPAPDLAAVALKIELAGGRGLDIDDLAPVIADLRRMGGN